jgi:MFS family permease
MTRDLRLVVGAVGLSSLGDALALVPLTLYVEEETGSGLAVAALLIALWGPVAVLAPVAGALVDRRETRGLLIVASLAQAVVVAVLAFVSAPGAVIALAALVGIGFAVAQPAEFALVPVVAGADRVQIANGHVETARYVGWLLGPLLGSVLAAGGGTRVALLVNAVTFLAVAGAAYVLRARRRPEEGPATRDRVRDGLAFLFRDRVLAVVMAVGFVSFLVFAASTPAEVFFARDDLDVGELGYGALITAWTVGMGIGATLVGIAVQGIGMAGGTVHLALAAAVGAFLVGGVGLGAKNVLMRTLLHERVPARMHGRAFAAFNGVRNGADLTAFALGGVLVAGLGARSTIAIAGVLPLLAALGGLVALRARRAEVAAQARPA